MILRRLGSKKAIAGKIIKNFPTHKVYYEPFFGTGSIYFIKPKAQYSILNDLDSDVFNFFTVVKDHSEELSKLLSITPMSEELFYYWRENQEIDPVKKALRFLFMTSYGYLGKTETFMLLHSNCSHRNKLEHLILNCSKQFKNAMLRNKDFRLFFNDIYASDKHIGAKDRFIYADPPYLDSTDNYNAPKWTQEDSLDLFETLENTGVRFAMSEFKHPFILEQAKERKLNIIDIGERQNLKNKRTEILITNYKKETSLFD